MAAQSQTIPAPPDVKAPPADAAKTASGLASKVITPGTAKNHPAAADTVNAATEKTLRMGAPPRYFAPYISTSNDGIIRKPKKTGIIISIENRIAFSVMARSLVKSF